MHAIVVYESMYGNTRHVAEAIGRGLDVSGTVRVVPISMAGEIEPSDYDLIVVGGPTHVHGMSRESTRQAAEEAAMASDGNLAMEPDSTSEGVREWLGSRSGMTGRAAAFDTRLDAVPLLTGRASKGIAKLLRSGGFTLVAEPESFLVDKDTRLLEGEEERAQAWGESLAAKVSG
ncbi:flavodoxin family protein [Parafrigoribacterium mesophilum]|uniref:flavodoxin family protein n=1 Tax=Parafrigoribacterium mesophilum TaxID=433646 RepID=UPI0031FCA758